MTVPITIAALLCGIALCIGYLGGYGQGKHARRPLAVPKPAPDVRMITRLTSRNTEETFQ